MVNSTGFIRIFKAQKQRKYRKYLLREKRTRVICQKKKSNGVGFLRDYHTKLKKERRDKDLDFEIKMVNTVNTTGSILSFKVKDFDFEILRANNTGVKLKKKKKINIQ